MSQLITTTVTIDRDPYSAKEPELLEEYNSIINDQLKSAVVEEVSPEEVGGVVNQTSGEKKTTHYMPRDAVVRQNKDTTKLRVVHDGSAILEDEGR